MADGCNVVPDEDDGQTPLVEYPSLYPGGGDLYVSPRVKIEAGARSALDPSTTRAVTPYVAGELPDWPFRVANVATLRAGTDLLGEASDPARPCIADTATPAGCRPTRTGSRATTTTPR